MKYFSFALIFGVLLTPLFAAHAQDNPNLDELLNQLANTDEAVNAESTDGAIVEETAAADPVMNAPEIRIQNTTYTFQGSEYTLTWTPIAGTAKVELSVKNADTDMDYTKVETVPASDGMAKINLTSQGTYMVKFTPVDDLSTPLGPDQIMTIKVEAPIAPTTTDPETTVQNPPQVGPAQDLLFGGLILVAIMYFVYRFRSNDA
jgi:hypothetical protein